MAIRLIVTITAAPGRGSELADLYKARCAAVMREPGCEQFEVFQSVMNSDKVVLLERWTDRGVLDAQAKLNSTRPPLPSELRTGTTVREDYDDSRTR